MFIFHRDVTLLKKKLLLNGFPCHMIYTVISKILTKYHIQQETNESVSTVAQRELSISLPYLGPLSNVIRRRLLKFVHRFYPTIKLRVVFKRVLESQTCSIIGIDFPLRVNSLSYTTYVAEVWAELGLYW